MSEFKEPRNKQHQNSDPSTGSLPARPPRSGGTYPGGTAGLGIGRRPNYGTELTIRLKDAHPAELYRVLLNWADKKLGSNDLQINLASFISGEQISTEYLKTSLETRSFQQDTVAQQDAVAQQDTGQDIPSHWAMRLSQQDSRFSARTWETNIGITRIDDSTYKLKVLNEYIIAPDFHGEVRPPQLSTPAFMRDILRDEKWDVYSGSSPVTALPQRVHASNADEFLRAVSDPDRKLLVFAVAKVHHGSGESFYPVNMVKLARSLEGVGIVYGLEDARDIQDTMGYIASHSLKKGDIPYQGYGQVYYPVRSSQEQMRTLRLPLEVIEAQSHRESDVHISALRCSINGVNFRSKSSLVIGSIADIRSLEQERESQERIQKIEESTKELAGKRDAANYEQLIATLKEELLDSQSKVAQQAEEIEELQQQNSKLKEDNEIFDTITKQEQAELEESLRRSYEQGAAQLRQRNQELEDTALKLSDEVETLTDILAPLKEFMDPAQMLEYLGISHPDKLVILPEAQKTAKQMGTLKDRAARKRANELLETIPTTLFDMKFREGSFEPQAFKAETGFEVNMTESKQTKARSDLMEHRLVDYKGTTVCAEAHIKFGNQPGNQIRVHFFFDEKEEKIVIAKVVDHLPIYSSTKAGKRR